MFTSILPFTSYCVLHPQLVTPAQIFFLSHIKCPVLILRLTKTNIYSNICVYLLLSRLAGKELLFFSYIIVSCSLKPQSIKCNACLKEVPVSEPFFTWSPTIHTTIPPSEVISYNKHAISLNFSKHQSDVLLYVLKSSYGGLLLSNSP